MGRRRKDYNYFDVFVRLADYSCQAAAIVNDVLQNFDEQELPKVLDEIHEIEHQADMLKHEMMRELAREFITPIEIEDIAEIAHLLDDVIDAVEDILIKIYTFNVKEMNEEAIAFGEIVAACCCGLKEMMEEFKDFKRSTLLKEKIIEINNLEGQGDDLYTKSMRGLFENSNDPIRMLTWSRIFDYFERSCDAAEHVADSVENIVMKNT